MRPAQAASEVPEGQAGLRFSDHGWTGKHTSGAVSTTLQPLSLVVSSTVRRIAVPIATGSDVSVSQTGWGLRLMHLFPFGPRIFRLWVNMFMAMESEINIQRWAVDSHKGT